MTGVKVQPLFIFFYFARNVATPLGEVKDPVTVTQSFLGNFVIETILKIGLHLPKSWSTVKCLITLGHSIYRRFQVS